MKKKIKEMIPSEEENHKKEVSRKHTIHVLANEKVRLNDTIGRNRYLKVEIDMWESNVEMKSETWEVGSGMGEMENEKWKIEHGYGKVENGKCKVENGNRK